MVHSVSSQSNCKQTNAMCVVRLSSTECGSRKGEQCCQKYHSTHQHTYKEVKCMDPKFVCVKKIDQSIPATCSASAALVAGVLSEPINYLFHYITLRSALCLYFLCGFVFICNAPCGASRTYDFHPIKI